MRVNWPYMWDTKQMLKGGLWRYNVAVLAHGAGQYRYHRSTPFAAFDFVGFRSTWAVSPKRG